MKKEVKKILDNYRLLIKDAWKQLQTKGQRHRQIPNIMTLSRLIAAPFFIIPAALTANVILIISFTIAFSLTDLLDGFIARKYHLVSELGKDLDAICDKVFAGTLLIGASFINPILLCNLALELVISVINIKGKVETQSPHSSKIGKVKTFVLFPLLGVGFLTNLIEVNTLFNILFVAATTLQLVTATSYLTSYHRYKRETQSKTLINDKEDVKISNGEQVVKKKKLTKEKIHQGVESNVKKYQELRSLLVHEAEIQKDTSNGNKDSHKKLLR